MKTFILLGALGLTTVCYGQTSNKVLISPAAQIGKAAPAPKVPEAPCGMTPEARATIESLVLHHGDFSLDDPAVDDVFKNLRAYFKLAATCRGKVGDTPAQLRGADDAAMLYSFEDLYDGNRYERELALNKTLLDQTYQQSNALADLTQRYNALLAKSSSLGPLFQQPTPIEMECGGGRCDGEILSPRPLPIVPFHMTCHVIVGKVQCDGDLTP
jgi:hypothetical protein